MNKLTFISLFFLISEASAQAPRDISFYLDNKQISQTAKDYHNGKFKADDGGKTYSIMDSLNTRNNVTRPFYLYLVSSMMIKSDGALGEGLGSVIKEYFEKSPNNVLDFLYSDSKLVAPQFKRSWAKKISGEFGIICENTERECTRKSKQQTLRKVRAENQARVVQFYKLIEGYFR